jgi:transposase
MRRSYSQEFKDEACRLVTEQKQTATQVAQSLNMERSILSYWLRKRGLTMSKPHELPSLSNDPKILQARIKELEGKLKHTQAERDFLKKATAYFAKETLSDSLLSQSVKNTGQ